MKKVRFTAITVAAALVLVCLLQPVAVLAAEDTDSVRRVQLENAAPGYLLASAAGVPEDVQRVEFHVWCRGEEDAAIYEGAAEGSGLWTAQISLEEHGFHAGEYRMLCWLWDASGNRSWYGLSQTALVAYAEGTLSVEPLDPQQTRFTAVLRDAALPLAAKVWFRVFQPERPDAVQAYPGSLQPDGSFKTTLIGSRQQSAGTYTVEACIGPLEDATVVGSSFLELAGVSEAGIDARLLADNPGAFCVTAAAEAPAGIASLRAAVWHAADQSDLVWYDLEPSDGVWTANVPVENHDRQFGVYHVHVYAALGNGLQAFAAGSAFEIPAQRYVWAERTDLGSYQVTMLGTGLPAGSVVQFPTWSLENGQDDLFWYEGSVQEDGSVSCQLDIAAHRAASPAFMTHVYQGGELLGAVAFDVLEEDMLPPVQARLARYCREVYEEVGWDLESVYLWTVRNITYTPRPWQGYAPDIYTREQWFATEGFETHRGDCFVFSAVFAALARGLGYDAQYVEGYVWSQRGLWADHGFVLIHLDGETCVCDPELQSVSSTGRNLFMQPSNRTSATYKW